MKKLAFIKKIILHPILFSIYPILYLTTYNIGHIYLMESLRSLLLAVLFGMFVNFLFVKILKNKNKAALATTLFLFVFFTYGHFYSLLKTFQLGEFFVGRHRLLFPISAAILLFGLFLIIRTKKELKPISDTMNVISIILIVFPLALLISDSSRKIQSTNEEDKTAIEYKENPPDIYHIVLDAYGRDDTIKELFGIDNSQFISDLEGLGFYVPECSRSNYINTQPSLATTFYMDYEENIWEGKKWQSRQFIQIFKQNPVRDFLESQGYQTLAFQSGVVFSEWSNADYYFAAPADQNLLIRSSLNRFEVQLLETTMLKVFIDIESTSKHLLNETGIMQYKQAEVQNIFKWMNDLPEIEEPKFVFTHLLLPHKPFVYGPNGEDMVVELGDAVMDMEYGEGYANQVPYLNQKVLEMIDNILKKSEQEPIIIIHGDHGPHFDSPQYRSTIFSAFYFPGSGGEALYPTISPVNYYRIIQNQYFGMNNELLPDDSYESNFTIIPDEYQVINDFGRCGN